MVWICLRARDDLSLYLFYFNVTVTSVNCVQWPVFFFFFFDTGFDTFSVIVYNMSCFDVFSYDFVLFLFTNWKSTFELK